MIVKGEKLFIMQEAGVIQDFLRPKLRIGTKTEVISWVRFIKTVHHIIHWHDFLNSNVKEYH